MAKSKKKSGNIKKPSLKVKKTRSQKPVDSNQLAWPLPRRVLFRPERSAYIKKDKSLEDCVFCLANKLEISEASLCVYKSKFSMVLLNKFPYNSGHLLVLPRRHCGDLLSLSDEEYLDLHGTLKQAIRAMKSIYMPAAMNIGLNHGAEAGAGLPDHLHYHLVPRWRGDLNFFPLIAETKLVIEALTESYQKYHSYFQSMTLEAR